MSGWKFRKHTPETWERAVRKFFREQPAEEWSIPGLCIECGIVTSTFYEYCKNPEYAPACQYAKDMVNRKREKMLEKGQGYGNGIVFLLKVNGYQDTQQIEVKQDLTVSGHMTLEEYLHDEEEEIQA